MNIHKFELTVGFFGLALVAALRVSIVMMVVSLLALALINHEAVQDFISRWKQVWTDWQLKRAKVAADKDAAFKAKIQSEQV